MTKVLLIFLLGIAAFGFWRALRGYRRGRVTLPLRDFVLSADREDDPVGFATGVWGNAAIGLFALAIAVYLLLFRN